MNPEKFIEKYEAALATQDWQQVAPLLHPDACITFSSGSGAGTGSSILINDGGGWHLLVEHLGPKIG